MALTVIFDRSALHGDLLDALIASRLHERIRHGQIVIYHTPILLEETIVTYANRIVRPRLIKEASFLLSIASNKWFLTRDEIWRLELVRNRSLITSPFCPPKEADKSADVLRDCINETISQTSLNLGLADRELERDKRNKQREIFIDCRNEIQKAVRANKSLKQQSKPPFAPFCKNEIHNAVKQTIRVLIQTANPNAIYCRWKSNMNHYPFFTSFVVGTLYAGYYAMIEQNQAIDINAQTDWEQLCYLNYADVVVSEDTRFFKNAFDEMWKPKGKRYLNTREFIELLS